MPLKREDPIKTITEGISWLATQCKLRSALHLFDANTIAHEFYCHLLDEIFDLELEVMDRIQANFPAIDLGDAVRKRVFQITADKSGDKVQATLNAYAKHNLQKKYGHLQIIVIGDRQSTYKSVVVPVGVTFSTETDVIGLDELLKIIDKRL